MDRWSGVSKRRKLDVERASILRHNIAGVGATLPELQPVADSNAAAASAPIVQWETDDCLGGSLEPEGVAGTSHSEPVIKVRARAKRYLNSDQPLKFWIPHRDEYGDILMQRHGRGPFKGRPCPACPPDQRFATPRFRCTECCSRRLVCKGCLLRLHNDLPLHVIEEWTRDRFVTRSLRDLGMVVQLGHPLGDTCNHPKEGHTNFMVIHTNGLHRITIHYCRCAASSPQRQQLLEFGWWPSTVDSPQTCASMQMLRQFHYLSLQSSINLTDYYTALEQMSEPWALATIPDRVEALRLIVRQYRNMKSLSRGGRFLKAGGVAGTSKGELSLACPACPHAGINIPDDFREVSSDKEFLYVLFIMMDANFRLKNRAHKNDHEDPRLSPGWSYFVAPDPFEQFLKTYVHQEDVSTCAGFQAIMLANSKLVRGNRTTGVVGIACRHELWRPTCMTPTQKGERQVNGDWAFLSTLKDVKTRVCHSYDINCQWSVRVWKRVKSYPAGMQLLIQADDVTFKIPKLHMQAHRWKCHPKYSFNYSLNVGRTDGECIERKWAATNDAAGAAAEMTPGGHQEYLDDVFGFQNHKKITNLDNTLARQMLEAIDEAVDTAQEFDDFNSAVKEQRPDEHKRWERAYDDWFLLEGWNQEGTDCPFRDVSEAPSFADVKAQLQHEERRAASDDEYVDVASKGRTAFIALGIWIEDASERIRSDLRKRGDHTLTQFQQAALDERRARLVRNISRFRSLLDVYAPGHMVERRDMDSEPELTPVTLPSSMSASARAALNVKLSRYEVQLREAAAREALTDLLNQLRARQLLTSFRRSNVRGTRGATAISESLRQCSSKAMLAASTYRRNRAALEALDLNGPWSADLKVLRDSDIRGINERTLTEEEKRAREAATLLRQATQSQMGNEDAEGDSDDMDDELGELPTRVVAQGETGDGHRAVSWIWHNAPLLNNQAIASSDPKLVETLRMEWAKSKIRAHHWRVQLLLLCEEMRRSLVFAHWMADHWRTLAKAASRDDALDEGKKAYAMKHAAAYDGLHSKWAAKWQPLVNIAKRTRFKNELVDLGATTDVPQGPVVIDVGYEEDDDDAVHGDLPA